MSVIYIRHLVWALLIGVPLMICSLLFTSEPTPIMGVVVSFLLLGLLFVFMETARGLRPNPLDPARLVERIKELDAENDALSASLNESGKYNFIYPIGAVVEVLPYECHATVVELIYSSSGCHYKVRYIQNYHIRFDVFLEDELCLK